MNYQDYIKYDPEKKQYTDSYGYVIDGVSSKALPSELASVADAVAIAKSAAASVATVSGGNFQTVTAGYGLTNQLAITTVSGAATITPSGTDANINVTINPKGLGIVDCKSYIAEWNCGIATAQTINAGNTKVWFNNLITSTFPAGFMTTPDIGGSTYDTFQNTSGRAIVLMVTACVRESNLDVARELGLWIARTGDSTIRYGQTLVAASDTTHNTPRAMNVSSIIRLANNESFSIWIYTNGTGVTIGGGSQTYNRPVLSYRLMP